MIQRLIGVFLLALFLAACSNTPMKSATPAGGDLPEIAPYDDPPIPPLDIVSDIPDAT